MHPSVMPERVVWRLSSGSASWDEVSLVDAGKRAEWMDAEGFGVTSVELRHDQSSSVDRWVAGIDEESSEPALLNAGRVVRVGEGGRRYDWVDIIELIVEITFPAWWS